MIKLLLILFTIIVLVVSLSYITDTQRGNSPYDKFCRENGATEFESIVTVLNQSRIRCYDTQPTARVIKTYSTETFEEWRDATEN